MTTTTKYKWHEVLSWMWQWTHGYRMSIAVCLLLDMARVALGWVFVLASKRAIDIATGDADGVVWHALLVLPAVEVLEYGCSSLSTWIAGRRTVDLAGRLKLSLAGHLLDAEWRGIERFRTGDVVSRMESDVAAVVSFATETLPSAVSLVMQFVGSLVILWALDPMLATALLFVLPFFTFFARIYARRLRRITLDVRQSESHLASQISESVEHRVVVKTLEATPSTLGRMRQTIAELVGHVRRQLRLTIATHLLVSGGFSVGFFLTFAWGVLQIARSAITYGTLTAFLGLAGRVQRPLGSLSRMLPGIVRAFASGERLMELESMPREDVTPHEPLSPTVGIRLHDVSFAYPSDAAADRAALVIDGLSYDFPPASFTAIVGETGAGKTTLVRLLLALVRPTAGAIEVYDETHTVPLDAGVRQMVAYVPQGNTLMSGTIRSNLLLARPDATEADMLEALDVVAADFVGSLPDGLDTPCGERGGGLSEGQAQRVAIARAVMRRAPILLLDEATSALDMQTEERVLAAITARSKAAGTLVVAVTHRMAMAELADQVLRL